MRKLITISYEHNQICGFQDANFTTINRAVPRDQHTPGDMDHKYDFGEVVAKNRYDEWKMTIGLRKVADYGGKPKRQPKPLVTFTIDNQTTRKRKKRAATNRVSNESKL